MPEDSKMERLLRESLGATPPPRLSDAFDRRLASQLRPRRVPRAGRFILAAYSMVALAISLWTMHATAVDWRRAAVAFLVPLLVLAFAGLRGRRPAR